MRSLHEHNLKSRLFEFQKRYTSTDTVGEERRALLREIVSKADPFNLERPAVTDFVQKSSGSPFAGLTVEKMQKFLDSVKSEFELLYPTSCSSIDAATRKRRIDAMVAAVGLCNPDEI